mgnify:CR=1 FL=1
MKYFFSAVFLITISTTYLNNRYFKSLQDQVFLYVDFNNYQNNLKTPLEIISNFEDEIPSINNVTIPIKVLKANYYIQNGDYDIALKLIDEGRRANPYLFISEYLLSKIYYEKGEYERAAEFSKISVDSLPNNLTHLAHYQKVLSQLGDIEELERIFNLSKDQKDEAIWFNHIILTVSLKDNYSSLDSIIAKEAVKLFPSNRKIAELEKIICYKSDKIILANQYDEKARTHFNDKEFELAIEDWESAKKIINNDEAYYLNIAKSLTQIKEFDKSLKELRTIERLNLSSDSGQLEFLLAMNYFQQEKSFQGCNSLKLSASKGYALSVSNLKKICP